MIRRAVYIITILIAFSNFAFAKSNIRTTQFIISADTILLDTLSIVPGTFFLRSIADSLIDTSLYKMDYAGAVIIAPKLIGREFVAHYRVFDFSLQKPYFHKKYSDYVISNDSAEFKLKTYSWTETPFESFSDINASGSISRGISIGNNQDVIMNSSMNLQLNGEIMPGVWILGSISDNNIPIQTSGNTQQLQDFDRVFVKIYDDKNAITMGDIEVNSENSYFLKYYKKAQGGMFETQQQTFKQKVDLKSNISYSISKGRHCSQQIEPIEGNQGPYPITGCQNESYIVVLSGTEKVYADGELLVRGDINDYVIDYNAATITFTSNFMITKDKRIVIEFEYSDQNYARSLITSNNSVKFKNSVTNISFFSEQDDKHQPYMRTLSDDDKQALSYAGDNPAYGSGAYIDSSMSENSVYYEKRDTIVNGKSDSVYIYSIDQTKTLYRVSFSYVGAGKGNYQIMNSSINGRVFQWIAPSVSGDLQGDYLPIVQLIAPKQKQVFTINNTTTIAKNTEITGEFAVSNNDINTFSNKDSYDNVGQAVNLGVKQTIPIVKDKHTLAAEIKGMFVQKYFDPVDAYRDIEFARNWNLIDLDTALNEQMLETKLSYITKPGTIFYQFNILKKEALYQGNQNSVGLNYNLGKYRLKYNGSILQSDNTKFTTQFAKSKTDISRCFYKRVWLGAIHSMEDNRLTANSKLDIRSDRFDMRKIYLQTIDSLKNGFESSVQFRDDEVADTTISAFKPETGSLDIAAKIFFRKNPDQQLQISATHRRVTVYDTTLLLEDENTNLGQLDYQARFADGMISSSTFYEFGSGMERDKEYMYYFVGDGLGVYMWDIDRTDYNKNGVADLNEFEVAQYKYEANYIMIFVPTNNYVKTYINSFNQTINLDPYTKWKSKDDIRKLVARFANRASYNMTKKNRLDDLLINLNPFNYEVNDTDLVSYSKTLRNDFTFNRRSAKFGAQYIYSNNENKILTANGAETKINIQNTINTKWNATQLLTCEMQYTKTIKKSLSDAAFFSNRVYNIDGNEYSPSITFRPSLYFEAVADYRYAEKKNKSTLGEHAEIHDFGIELKYSSPQQGKISASCNYVNIAYNYASNTSLTYIMLESLLPGNNLIWQLDIQRRIAKNLQMSIQYEGKRSDNAKVVHTGQVQLRAFF